MNGIRKAKALLEFSPARVAKGRKKGSCWVY